MFKAALLVVPLTFLSLHFNCDGSKAPTKKEKAEKAQNAYDRCMSRCNQQSDCTVFSYPSFFSSVKTTDQACLARYQACLAKCLSDYNRKMAAKNKDTQKKIINSQD